MYVHEGRGGRKYPEPKNVDVDVDVSINMDMDMDMDEEISPERRAELEAMCARLEKQQPLSFDMHLLWLDIHSVPVDDLAHLLEHLEQVIRECDSEAVVALAERFADVLDAEIDRRLQHRERVH